MVCILASDTCRESRGYNLTNVCCRGRNQDKWAIRRNCDNCREVAGRGQWEVRDHAADLSRVEDVGRGFNARAVSCGGNKLIITRDLGRTGGDP